MRIIYLLFICLLFINPIDVNGNEETSNEWKYIHGKVINIIEDTIDEENFMRYQRVLVRLTEKDLSSEVEVENIINTASIYKIIVKSGDEIIIVANIVGETI